MKHPWPLLLLAFSLSVSAATTLPPPVIPAGVGVNIHFVRGQERDLDMIAAAGFKWVRMDFSWGGTEPRRGDYDWSGYDELMGNLEKRGLGALFILDYSNPLYETTVTNQNPVSGKITRTTASPQHPESVAAFARWAQAAASHYAGRRIIWEIWNEPNIRFWAPEPDVRQYITLALATCRAIRSAQPEATIVAPATSQFPWEFLEKFFESGALSQLDAVSVHPYREPKRGPETAAADYARLRSLIEQHAPSDKARQLVILSGEWGYSTTAKGVTRETQAAYAVRQQMANLLAGVPLSIWYDWKNDGTDPAEHEHNFGTVTHDLQPKPAYEAIRTMTSVLRGARIERRLPAGTNDFVLLFRADGGNATVAAWTTGEPGSVTLPLTGAPAALEVVEMTGSRRSEPVTGNNVTLKLTPHPQYLLLGKAGVRPGTP
jgi:hypothetical protein